MNKKVLWFIVIDSALILCALMYFLRSEPVSDQTIKPMQEVSNVVQVDEPKSTIQTNKVDDSSSEVPQITDSEKQASSEHEHHQSTARLIIPERDELGLSTHAMMQSGKDGYPNITSTDFSFILKKNK